MSGEPLAIELRRFLRERSWSLEELESVLLLHRCRASAWDEEWVASKLGIPSSSAHEALVRLVRQELVAQRANGMTSRFEYHPRTAALAALVDALQEAYVERRIEIITELSRNAVERVRNTVVRNFADAFLLGKKTDG